MAAPVIMGPVDIPVHAQAVIRAPPAPRRPTTAAQILVRTAAHATTAQVATHAHATVAGWEPLAQQTDSHGCQFRWAGPQRRSVSTGLVVTEPPWWGQSWLTAAKALLGNGPRPLALLS